MSSGSGGNSNNPQGFPNMDNRFRDMRDKMNRDRDAFFSDTPQSLFGRESPFFRVSPLNFQILKFSNSKIVMLTAHAA